MGDISSKLKEHKLWRQAKEKVLEIIADDDKWNLFVQQVEQYGIDLNEYKNIRKKAKSDENYMASLSSFYIAYSAMKICDNCEYNPKPRRGLNAFAEKRVFHCSWEKTEGDVFYEQTHKVGENTDEHHLFTFDNSRWQAIHDELSKRVLEQHTDTTKAPPWLDVKKNMCIHQYTDLKVNP